ncbi:hypothetical protein FRX31_009789 [Thalictrum thalictroides]|uniref:Uncharacterized protein n=1 Tax=Thalictrum thalictroides TaxID=46969 RepID=A0A7J6WUA8_THATH|nr:hypothetical protein FRX31_009789 [Thalictrum thalictroides]
MIPDRLQTPIQRPFKCRIQDQVFPRTVTAHWFKTSQKISWIYATSLIIFIFKCGAFSSFVNNQLNKGNQGT